MTETAHVDTFARDRQPPRDQWPELMFDLPELRYPERMNCASELLGGAIARGQGDRVAIRSTDGLSWTYRELEARANRIAQRAGRRPGRRARQPRAAARPQQPDDGGVLVRGHEGRRDRGGDDAAAAREGAHRHRRPRPRSSHALCDAAAGRGARPRATGVPDARRVALFETDAADGVEARRPCKPATFADVATLATDTCADRLHVGHHRQAEGDDALPPRRDRGVRLLAEAHAEGDAGRRVHRQPAARVHVRAGRAAAVPAAHRRGDAAGRAAVARSAARRDRAASRRPCCSPRRRPTARWRCACAGRRPREPAQVRVGGRGASRGDAQAVEGRDRHRDHRRHRLDRAAAHLHLARRRRRAARRDRQAGARLPRLRARRRRAGRLPRGQVGRLAVKGPTGCRYLDDPRQANYVQGGWNLHRRRLPASTTTASSSTRRAPTT